MNNNPDTKDKSGNNDFSDIPAEELPPVESCIMLSEMDQDNYVKPVRMYYESDTKQTSASSLAVLFGFILTCLFAGVILTLWRAFNPYGFFIFRCIKRRSEIWLSDYIRLIIFTAAVLGIMGLTYVIVPPLKLLFIPLSVVALVLGIFLLKGFEQRVYDLLTLYMIVLFIVFLFFMSFKVFFTVTVYNEIDYNAQLYCLQGNVPVQYKNYDHYREEKLIYDDSDEGIGMYDYNVYNTTIFETKHGVDTFFDTFEEEYKDINSESPVSRQISADMRRLMEPALQKYDDGFFRNNIVIMMPEYFHGNIGNYRLPVIYSDLTTGDLSVNVKADLLDDTPNNGICFILVEIPKNKLDFNLISHLNQSISI